MKDKLTVKDITPSLKSAVDAVLMATAYAKTMRAQVDIIQRAILTEAPLTTGARHVGRAGRDASPITDPARVYLCDDPAQLEDYFAECDKRERAAGLKEGVPVEHCPALVAEELQMFAEHALIDCAADMLRYEGGGKELHHRLLCAGMDKYREFINLVVGLVVNLPEFVSPLQRAS